MPTVMDVLSSQDYAPGSKVYQEHAYAQTKLGLVSQCKQEDTTPQRIEGMYQGEDIQCRMLLSESCHKSRIPLVGISLNINRENRPGNVKLVHMIQWKQWVKPHKLSRFPATSCFSLNSTQGQDQAGLMQRSSQIQGQKYTF